MSTLKQVADKAGVSIATASYVVSGRKRALNRETVTRVWNAVRELNYVPMASARRLKGIGSKTLGIIFPHEVSSLSASPFFGPLFDGIVDTATEHRYSTMLFTGLSWYQAEQGYGAYVDGRCDGHLLIAPSSRPELIGDISGRGIPLCVLSAVVEEPGVACFDTDNRAGAEAAVDYLVKLGHQRIGHVTGNAGSSSSREREEGFRAAMARHGLPVPESRVFRGDFHLGSGMAAFSCFDQLPIEQRPTAVFAANDDMALGVLEAARARGVSVPHRLSVLGFDDTLARYAQPGITTFRQSLRQIGQAAARHLIDVLTGTPAQSKVTRFPATFVERDSCASAPTEAPRPLSPA